MDVETIAAAEPALDLLLNAGEAGVCQAVFVREGVGLFGRHMRTLRELGHNIQSGTCKGFLDYCAGRSKHIRFTLIDGS